MLQDHDRRKPAQARVAGASRDAVGAVGAAARDAWPAASATRC